MQVVSSLLYIESDEENRIESCTCNGIRVIAHPVIADRVIAHRAIRLFAPRSPRPRNPDRDATLLGNASPGRRRASAAALSNRCLQRYRHTDSEPRADPLRYQCGLLVRRGGQVALDRRSWADRFFLRGRMALPAGHGLREKL